MNHPARPTRRHVIRSLAIASAAAALPLAGRAQAYPNRPVRIVVSYPAGGIADLLARSVGNQLTALWGHSVLVENRPGASQTLAAIHVMRSAPDGYTFMLCDDSAFTLLPSVRKSMPYQLKDFAPVANLANSPFVITAARTTPFSNVKDFVAYAKANPGRLNFASLGVGNITHLLIESLKRSIDADITHVPYQGYSQAINDVVANQAQLAVGGIGGPVVGHVRTGALKALAVTGDTRSPVLPEVPTLAEAGVPGFEPKAARFVLVGPAGLPAALAQTVAAAVSNIVKQDIAASVLVPNGLEPVGEGPAALERTLVAYRDLYARIAAEARLPIE